jgi:hypothetical protein
VFIFKVTKPSSMPYRTHPACAKRAYPDPPPVIPVPDTGVAEITHLPSPRSLGEPRPNRLSSELVTWVSFRPEMFSGIGALPKPATESHVVNRGTPVAPCRPKAQRKRITRVGSPRIPEFPKYHELFEQPHHCKAAGNSLTAKGREHT